MQVWRTLGRFQEVEDLVLGGELFCQFPMNVEELVMILPEGARALAGVRKLVLLQCGNLVDDAFFGALASAGCGQKLTGLTLERE